MRDPTPGSRVVNFTRNGEKRFSALFGESEQLEASSLMFVVAGLDPAIPVLLWCAEAAWMPGTSPGMTNINVSPVP